jgi:hypothetical protein
MDYPRPPHDVTAPGHRARLPKPALEALRKMKGTPDDSVFSGPTDTEPLSGMELLMMLDRMNRRDTMAYGKRSSFRDRPVERSKVPREGCEMALAHTVENANEPPIGAVILSTTERQRAWSTVLSSSSEI